MAAAAAPAALPTMLCAERACVSPAHWRRRRGGLASASERARLFPPRRGNLKPGVPGRLRVSLSKTSNSKELKDNHDEP
ncbi:hypothetical protein NN561_005147 [Cricetulus griseus]